MKHVAISNHEVDQSQTVPVVRIDNCSTVPQLFSKRVTDPVSYTHLTLPTIYSV